MPGFKQVASLINIGRAKRDGQGVYGELCTGESNLHPAGTSQSGAEAICKKEEHLPVISVRNQSTPAGWSSSRTKKVTLVTTTKQDRRKDSTAFPSSSSVPALTPSAVKDTLKRRRKTLQREIQDRKAVVKKTESRLKMNALRTERIDTELRNASTLPTFESPNAKRREWELQRVKQSLHCADAKHRQLFTRESMSLDALQRQLSIIDGDLVAQMSAQTLSQAALRNLPSDVGFGGVDSDVSSVEECDPAMKRRRVALKLMPEITVTPQELAVRATFSRLTWEVLDSAATEEILRHTPRTAIRLALVALSGSTLGAYSRLKVNRSAGLSLNELSGGLDRMKIPWRKILQKSHIPNPTLALSLYKLFDRTAEGELGLVNLFPNITVRAPTPSSTASVDLARISTPEAWTTWCQISDGEHYDDRKPKWYVDRAGLSEIMKLRNYSENVKKRRDWMRHTMHQLKARGLTDGACRELIARHLPRGKGPKDSAGCKLLDSNTVDKLRKSYVEKTMRPSNRVQRMLLEFAEQKTDLKKALVEFRTVTDERLLEKREIRLQRLREWFEQQVRYTNVAEITDTERTIRTVSYELNIPLVEVHACCVIFAEIGNAELDDVTYDQFRHFILSAQSNLSDSECDRIWKDALEYKQHNGNGNGAPSSPGRPKRRGALVACAPNITAPAEELPPKTAPAHHRKSVTRSLSFAVKQHERGGDAPKLVRAKSGGSRDDPAPRPRVVVAAAHKFTRRAGIRSGAGMHDLMDFIDRITLQKEVPLHERKISFKQFARWYLETRCGGLK